jgi:hypothetical protein
MLTEFIDFTRPRFGSLQLMGLCLLVSVGTLHAAGPGTISYEGNLFDPVHQPVPDENYTMSFDIYDAPTGGNRLYTQTLPQVPVSNAFFSVELGGYQQLFQTHDQLWLETGADLDQPQNGIQSDELFSPRQRLVNVPYSESATHAHDATLLDGAPRSQFVENGARQLVTRGDNGSVNTLLGGSDISVNHGWITANDDSGNPRVGMKVDNNDNGEVDTFNDNGEIRTAMAILSSGEGFIELLGPNGNQNLVLSALDSNVNHGFLMVMNSVGEQRGEFYVDPFGIGTVNLYRDNGDLQVELSSSADNSGFLAVYGQNDTENVVLTSFVDNSSGGIVAVLDGLGIERAGMYVDQNGFGVSFAEMKQFVVDHPDDPDKKIVYVSLEGPEAAIFQRGKVQLMEGRGKIILSDDFTALAAPDTVTVQLTPVSLSTSGVGIAAMAEGAIEIGELDGGTGEFEVHYIVHATRLRLIDHQPVINTEEFSRKFRVPRKNADTSSSASNR